MGRGRGLALLAGGGVLGAALWWRTHPSACPYSQRFWVEAPHPFITRPRLREILEPRPGERLLEVGPGTGYYALPVAEWVSPGGTLDAVDVQQEMLDHTMRRAAEQGIGNISPTRADARELPFEDDSFDAILCVHVLEHVADDRAALRELRRVLRPRGWAVIQVPILRDKTIEDPAEQDPAQRLRRFGQDDHVRVYGEDFFDRLSEAGFTPDVVDMKPQLSRGTRWRCGLDYADARIGALPGAWHVYCARPSATIGR
jgi:SAM-dependent methyltransferase